MLHTNDPQGKEDASSPERDHSPDPIDLSSQNFRTQSPIEKGAKQEAVSEREQQPSPAPPAQPDRSRMLRLILIGLLATAGVRYLTGSDPAERREQELRETLSPKELASPVFGLSDILIDVEDAIEHIKAGHFESEVREVENHLSGVFNYEFDVKPEFAKGNKTVRLTGVSPSDPERDTLLDALRESNMIIKSEAQKINDGRETSLLRSMLPSLLFYGALIGGLIYLSRRAMKKQSGMMGDFMQAEAEIVRGGELPDRFADLGGLDHVLDEVRELKRKIEDLQKGELIHRVPKGILLSGPPGVGKTKLVRTLAGEVEAPFIKFDCSQLSTQLLVGSGTGRVTNAFAQARKLRDLETERLRALPGASGLEEGVVIMCLDEFDSIGLKRADESYAFARETEHMKIVNTLLNELDGFNQARNKNIIVFAATNNPEVLDPALMRPGRFTKDIHIDIPRSSEQRYEILKALEPGIVQQRGFLIESDSALKYIAKITPGKTGDHLRQILEEASELASIDERYVISQQDLFEAAQRADSGRIQKNYLSRSQHEAVAHHEHGHAIASLACGINIFLVSMLPRGDSAGRVIPDPQGLAESLTTLRDYAARILISAGGRAAELAQYGPAGVSDGAISDIEHIQTLVANMISVGMLDDLYSMNLRRLPPDKWKDEHHQLINRLSAHAVEVVTEIIRTVGRERMEELVDKSLTLNGELVGDEAQEFYLTELDADTRKQIREIAERFIEDPLADRARKAA